MFIKATCVARVANAVQKAKTQDGHLVCNFNISAQMTASNGTPKEVKARVAGYGPVAEAIEKLDLAPGDVVSVLGDPRGEVYVANGETKGYVSIVAQSVSVLARGASLASGSGSAPARQAPAQRQSEQPAAAPPAAQRAAPVAAQSDNPW